MSTTNTKDEPSVLSNKPYVTALLEMADCRYRVEINGVTINRGAQPVTVEIPVNHWLRSGENEVSLFVYASKETKTIAPNAQCSVSLRFRSDDALEISTQLVSRLVYSGKDAIGGSGTESSTAPGKYDSSRGFIAENSGDVEVGKVIHGPLPTPAKLGQMFTQKISMPLPFPEWAFFRSDSLPDIDNLTEAEANQYFESLYVQYQRLHKALKRKDVDSILPLFEERNREMDIAMYYPPGIYQQKIEKAFKNAINDPELKLWDAKDEYLSIYTHSNTKLVELVDNDFGDATAFTMKGYTERYPIIFRRQNNQWIITR